MKWKLLPSNDTKIRLFDIAFFYFLPFAMLIYGGQFFSSLIESSWLPSEKESVSYLATTIFFHSLRMILAASCVWVYLHKAAFLFRKEEFRQISPLGFLSALTLSIFFFGLTAYHPGFSVVPEQGLLFVVETFFFRFVPMFFVYGISVHLIFSERTSLWTLILVSSAAQVGWNVITAAWNFVQAGVPLEVTALLPSASLILAIAILKLRGVWSSLLTLVANALAYGAVLWMSRFPEPSLVNNVLTLAASLALVYLIQNWGERGRLRVPEILDWQDRFEYEG